MALCKNVVSPLLKQWRYQSCAKPSIYNQGTVCSGIPPQGAVQGMPYPHNNDCHIDGLVQERRNSIANALELRLSCTNPLTWASQHLQCSNSLFRLTSQRKHQSSTLVWPLWGKFTSTSGCPSQRASNMETGPRFNIKISSYQYRKSHCGDKTVVRSSYLNNGISYIGKTTSLYWIRALV